MVTFGDMHQQMSGKNSNWLSDIKQCIHYKEPGLDCTLEIHRNPKQKSTWKNTQTEAEAVYEQNF